MAAIKFNRDLAIGERVEDVLRNFRTAEIRQQATRGASVRILATASGADVLSDVFVGDRQEIERSEVSDANRSPIEPEDELLPESPARPQERIRMSADNQSGAARTIFVKLIITEL